MCDEVGKLPGAPRKRIGIRNQRRKSAATELEEITRVKENPSLKEKLI